MKGSKKQVQDFSLYVGWAEAKVVAINPDKEELEKLGYSPEEEPTYADTKKEVDNQRIDVYLEEIKTGYIFRKSFWLENENVATKPEEGDPKPQWVNQSGQNFYAFTKKDLPEWFTHFRKKEGNGYVPTTAKIIRQAKVGEAQLLDFLRKWLSYNYNDSSTNILLDLKKIFNGNFSELKEAVNGEFAVINKNGKEYPCTVVEMLQVQEKEIDGEIKSYPKPYKTTLAGYQMKYIRNTDFSEENIHKWMGQKKSEANPDGRYLKDWEKLAIEISQGEHRSKDHYSFDLMREYKGEEENYMAGSKTISGEGKPVKQGEADY